MNVLLTHGTVGPGHFLNALVGILKVVWQTHVTPVAVEIVTPSSNLKC